MPAAIATIGASRSSCCRSTSTCPAPSAAQSTATCGRAADGAGHVDVERQHELREAPVMAIAAGIAPRADEQAVVGLEHADLRAAVVRLHVLLERDLAQVLLGEDARRSLVARLAARIE